MPLTRLSLTNFRSYPDALITPGPDFVVLTGENGAGQGRARDAAAGLTLAGLTPHRPPRHASRQEPVRHKLLRRQSEVVTATTLKIADSRKTR
jgi:hypothetical protein